MKILIVTGTFKPSINGVAISTESHFRNFVKLGHQVLVIAPNNVEYKKKETGVLRYPSIPNPFAKDYPIPLLPLTPKIFNSIKKFKPDIVHVHHPYHIGYFASIISEQLKIPLVFTYHTKHDDYAKRYLKFLPDDVKVEFILNNVLEFSKKCDLVIAPSKDIESFLLKNNIEKVAVIPSFVDDLEKTQLPKRTLLKKLNLPENKKVLLFVGRLAVEKNINILVDSVTHLPEDFILVICGTGPQEMEIKERVKKLGLKRRVFLIGKVERKDLGSYYSVANYFYYASKSETQGLIYWEAISFGLPIISVDSKVAREWIKDSFGVITKNSAVSIANGAKEIAKRNYDLLSKNALKYSMKFTSKKSTQKMVEEYKKLI